MSIIDNRSYYIVLFCFIFLPTPGLLGGHKRRDPDGRDGWCQERSGHRTGQQRAVRQRVVQADQ